MDDIKMFAKKYSVLQTISIYNQDIGMEFNIENCAIMKKKREKREIHGRNRITKSIKLLEIVEKNYEKLQESKLHQREMKEKARKTVFLKNMKTSRKQTLQQKSYKWNATWAMLVMDK